MDACRLMVCGVPESRVAVPIGRVNMVHALGQNRAFFIQFERAKLMFRQTEIPFRVPRPAAVVPTLLRGAAPAVPGLVHALPLAAVSLAVAGHMPGQLAAPRIPTEALRPDAHPLIPFRAMPAGPTSTRRVARGPSTDAPGSAAAGIAKPRAHSKRGASYRRRVSMAHPQGSGINSTCRR